MQPQCLWQLVGKKFEGHVEVFGCNELSIYKNGQTRLVIMNDMDAKLPIKCLLGKII